MRRRTEAPAALPIVLLLLLAAAGVPAAELRAGAGWTSFRGDPQLTGRARGDLAAQPRALWSFRASDGFASTAAISGGRVYVGSLDGHLYALSLDRGELQWSYRATEAIKSSPLVSGGAVIFGDEGGKVHAVDAVTGERRWIFEAEAAVTSSPTDAGDCLLLGSYDNRLYCVDVAGALRWSVETDGYVHGTPAVWGESAVAAGCDGFLRAVRLRDGTETARLALGGYVGASPAVVDGVAFVGTFESQILAIDLEQGEVLWTYHDPQRPFPFYASAAVAAGVVVVGGRDKRVHALDAGSGRALWVHAAGARIDASPVIVGERVLVADMSGDLVALDLESGEVGWRFETGSAFEASPAVGEGRLVIGTADGTLYCFG